MHQVLSYETAVRANSSREFSEYVTKRTCVSLVLTIAFIALISGYLLGNFVAERKYHIRQMVSKAGRGVSAGDNDPGSVELTSVDYLRLQELHAYAKSKEKLLSSAQALSKTLPVDEAYLSSSINTVIFNKYISCTHDIPPNTAIESSQFIEQLVDNTAARQRDCMRIIQLVIDDKLGNA